MVVAGFRWQGTDGGCRRMFFTLFFIPFLKPLQIVWVENCKRKVKFKLELFKNKQKSTYFTGDTKTFSKSKLNTLEFL